MENEEYRVIPQYEQYEVSNLGNVRFKPTQLPLKQTLSKDGYKCVCLYDNKFKSSKHRVHRLVMLAFSENPENKPIVDHIDGNRENNCLTNLRYATVTENNFNKKMYKNNQSNVKGIYHVKSSDKWRAQITINKERLYLGMFETLEEAKQARVVKARELFGNFTNISEL